MVLHIMQVEEMEASHATSNVTPLVNHFTKFPFLPTLEGTMNLAAINASEVGVFVG